MCSRAGSEDMGAFASSQTSFIEAVVQPLVQKFALHVPALGPTMLEGVDRSLAHWRETAAGFGPGTGAA